MSAPEPKHRRLFGVVLLLLALAGGALLWSSSLVWAIQRVNREEPLPPIAYALGGSSAVPMLVAAGFLLLAAVVAVLATRKIGRIVVAVVVLGVCVATAIQLVHWSGQSAGDRQAALVADGVKSAIESAEQVSAMAVPLAIGGLLLAVVAAVGLLVVRDLPLMGSKYERTPAKKPAAATSDDPQQRDRELWTALDRGEDPTENDEVAIDGRQDATEKRGEDPRP